MIESFRTAGAIVLAICVATVPVTSLWGAEPELRFASTAPADAVVLVEVNWSGKSFTVPGFVIHSAGGRSFVAIQSLTFKFFQAQSAWPEGQPTVTILWGEPDVRRVGGEVAATMQSRTKWIVSGPADELPAPLPASFPTYELVEPMPLKAIGFPNRQDVRPANRLKEDAVLQRTLFRSVNEVAGLEVSHKGGTGISMGVALTETGKVVGVRWVDESRPEGEIANWYQLGILGSMIRPSIDGIAFRPISGDEQRVRYQFVVTGTDPIGWLRTMWLYVRFDEQLNWGGALRPPSDRLAIKDPVKLKLAKAIPDEAFTAQNSNFGVPAIDFHPGQLTWVGVLEAPHPGRFDKVMCAQQIAMEGEDGTVAFQAPNNLSYLLPIKVTPRKGKQSTAEPKLPPIPGLRFR